MKRSPRAWRVLLGCILLVAGFAFCHVVAADYLAGHAAAWFADATCVSSPYELALR